MLSIIYSSNYLIKNNLKKSIIWTLKFILKLKSNFLKPHEKTQKVFTNVIEFFSNPSQGSSTVSTQISLTMILIFNPNCNHLPSKGKPDASQTPKIIHKIPAKQLNQPTPLLGVAKNSFNSRTLFFSSVLISSLELNEVNVEYH